MPPTSLSIVFGTQTTGSPYPELVGDLEAAVAADGDEGVEAAGLEGGHQIVRPVDLHLVAVLVPADAAEGIAAVGGAEDGAAQVGDAADFGRPSGTTPLKESRPS